MNWNGRNDNQEPENGFMPLDDLEVTNALHADIKPDALIMRRLQVLACRSCQALHAIVTPTDEQRSDGSCPRAQNSVVCTCCAAFTSPYNADLILERIEGSDPDREYNVKNEGYERAESKV